MWNRYNTIRQDVVGKVTIVFYHLLEAPKLPGGLQYDVFDFDDSPYNTVVASLQEEFNG